MKNLLKKLFPNSAENILSKDLKRLNEVHAEMGGEAIRFVLSGKGETVLSTLSVHGGGEKLRIGGHRYHSGKDRNTHLERAKLFLNASPYDKDLLVRYAKVLAAASKAMPSQAPGSDKTPAALRMFLTEAFSAASDLDNDWRNTTHQNVKITGLTAENLISIAEACDGSAEDVFEMLFWEDNQYGVLSGQTYRTHISLKPLIMANAQSAISGALRCPAKGRRTFLNTLSKWKLVSDEPFLSHVLEQCGDGSKEVRGAAVSTLKGVPANVIEPLAVERLGKGKVSVRAGMVEVLLGLKTQSATDALTAHVKTEKTARIVAAIENAVTASDAAAQSDAHPDDATGYTAIDGSRVNIPPFRPLETGALVTLSADERKVLNDLIALGNKKIKEWNNENKDQQYYYKRPLWKNDQVKQIEKFLTSAIIDRNDNHDSIIFLLKYAPDFTKPFLAKMPRDQVLRLAFASKRSPSDWLSMYSEGVFEEELQDYLSSPEADLRAIDQLWCETGFDVWGGGRTKTKAVRGDLLHTMIPQYSWDMLRPSDLPADAVWPYLAENFETLDRAFGIGVKFGVPYDPVLALSCLATMPKMPMRYLAPVLDFATGERKTGKAEARKLLENAPQVDDRLAALLDDNRQAIRAGAAEWMAERGHKSAIPPLKKRLKKEKSELAKAAILTTLSLLGEQLDAFVGPKALMDEAEAGLKKAKFDKLDWLGFSTLPRLKFRNGKAVPDEIPRWWIFLAFRLKQPGGNALFEIYLDRLAPDSAEALSQWVFDSWITYDIVVPSDEEANAYAEQHADRHYQQTKRWLPDYTREQAFAELRRGVKSDYQNSGTATKGILALASRIPAQRAADRVRAYLRDHGSRTSQATSLLEVMAGKGDPVSLQVVIAAATRLKQKSVQARAGELVQVVADQKGWSMDELADRIVPAAGLDDEGYLDLPCGPDQKLYRAVLGEDLTFVLRNPDGKIVKALSSGKDEATRASKKQFSASKKELKQVISMQSARLYEGLCGERVWTLEDWTRDFRNHPIMRHLIARVVWQGLDADGQVISTFRPTAEGEYTDAGDNDVDIADLPSVRIAHGAMMDAQAADLWAAHLKDYEIKPLFTQFGRALLHLDAAKSGEILIEDRKGWVLETFKLRGTATKLGYERGQAEDGGWFYEYRKGFNGVGLTAVIHFTGNWLPEENRNAALISLSFEKSGNRRPQPVKLGEVPEVLLSECWNDFHTMAASGAHDPNWEKTCEW